MKGVYECGCAAGGDLISSYCPVHTNSPIVAEFTYIRGIWYQNLGDDE